MTNDARTRVITALRSAAYLLEAHFGCQSDCPFGDYDETLEPEAEDG